jgi:hypothetical protein
MATEATFQEMLEKLPPEKRREVLDFLDFIIRRPSAPPASISPGSEFPTLQALRGRVKRDDSIPIRDKEDR